MSRRSPACTSRAHLRSGRAEGVAGRNSDNTFIQQVLMGSPGPSCAQGMEHTYAWIATQFGIARPAGAWLRTKMRSESSIVAPEQAGLELLIGASLTGWLWRAA